MGWVDPRVGLVVGREFFQWIGLGHGSMKCTHGQLWNKCISSRCLNVNSDSLEVGLMSEGKSFHIHATATKKSFS